MSCPRCAGLMVAIALIDWDGTYLHYPAQKCVTCGNVEWILLLRNTNEHPPVGLTRSGFPAHSGRHFSTTLGLLL
jgi:hypothetical protein